MASNLNLWVTPPNMNKNLIKFVDLSDDDMVLDTPSMTSRFNNSERWFQSLCKFHEERSLEMIHLPEEISKTKEALEDILSLEIKDFSIPPKANSVHVFPLHPESLDPMIGKWKPNNNNGTKYRFSSSETFLCISKLPIDMDQERFVQLVSKYGAVARAFLVFHHITDQSTGLGLVEFCTREVACQARNLLHGNNGLYCDWLDHRLVTYSCLYSRCLLVPDIGLQGKDPRKVLSCVAVPLYCQAVPGCDTVLVEFSTSEQATSTWKTLQDSNIEVHFANPGKSAVKLYEKFLIDLFNSKKNVRNIKLPVCLPLGQLPQNFIDGCFRLLGNTLPSLPSEDKPKSAPPSLHGSVPVPSLNNAFHFPLACSPLRPSKQQIPSGQSLPAVHTAFNFGLPCSPVLKILGPLRTACGTQSGLTQSSAVLDLPCDNPVNEVSPEVSVDGDSLFTLSTPPAWKDFSLLSFSLTPENPVSDPARSIPRGIRPVVPSSNTLGRSRPQPCKRLLTEDECPQPIKSLKQIPLADLSNCQATSEQTNLSSKPTWAKWNISELKASSLRGQDENLARGSNTT